jgi:serine/threonine protein kinase
MSALAAAPIEHAAVPRQGPFASELAQPVAGYRLEAVLGRGRQSVVYLARQLRGGRRVALKVARRASLQGMGTEKNLCAQFAVQAALAHRHVVQVFDQGQCGGDAYLAMEHAARGPLAPHDGRLGTARIATLFAQAASALGWLHQNGWVHRDVKPGNLLLRADGSLALGDFGCACRTGEAGARPGLVVGTPRYAAPEQSDGAPSGPAADVYGLGACLYETLAGKPLFPGETLSELQGQHQLAPVPRLPRESAGWQPLVDAMLAKDPGQRPRDGLAVLSELTRKRHSLLRPFGRGSMHESRIST